MKIDTFSLISGKLKTQAVVCIIALPLLFCGCDYFSIHTDSPEHSAPLSSDAPQKAEPLNIQILCTGDIMVHSSQIKSQLSGTDKYDYKNNYKYVKPYIEAADLAICNLETTFAGKPYTGYPNFSSPDELAEAISWAGFDVVSTANNHMFDKGTKGLLRTLDVLNEHKLNTTGSRKELQAPEYAMSEVKGLKIATIAYTYETPSSGTAINGHIVPADAANLINSFDYNSLDEDLAKIEDACSSAKSAGADIVVLFFHWGEEYQMSSNKWQKVIASYMVKNTDIDVIFGAHTHVLQEAVCLEKDQTDTQAPSLKVPVFYSLGNFISNQRLETLNNRFTETGAMAIVDIKFDPEKKEIADIHMSAIPTWVAKYHQAGRPTYEIIPLDASMDSNPTLQQQVAFLNRARQAREDAIEILQIE